MKRFIVSVLLLAVLAATHIAWSADAGRRVWIGTYTEGTKSKGIYILFNTGRNVSMRKKTIAQLKAAGFAVDGLCAHYKGERLAKSKQRCRQSFVNNGFTIIANIGNRSTDFTGRNYERAYRLPNYGNRLG